MNAFFTREPVFNQYLNTRRIDLQRADVIPFPFPERNSEIGDYDIPASGIFLFFGGGADPAEGKLMTRYWVFHWLMS